MQETAHTAGVLRRLLVVLALIAEVGLLLELALLEHTESAWQWVPLVLLLVALPLTAMAITRPSAAVVRMLRGLGGLMVAAAALGLFLHYRGNVEFELERDGALGGWALFVQAMMGATPALAPGAMAQLGLVLLLATYRHPLLGIYRT